MPQPLTISELVALFPLPVTGSVSATVGLTDAELRASAVPIAFATPQPVLGPLTNAELRAAAISVTSDPLKPFLVSMEPGYGAASEEKQAQPMPPGTPSDQVLTVQGHPLMTPLLVNVVASTGGGLTDTQLRATAVPMSLATLPALVAGSAVIGHVIHDTGSTTAVTGNVTAVQATGSNLHVVVDTAPTTAVTGPLTDTQLRNTAVPVSLATLPALVAGSAVIGHVIADTGSTTAVTGNVAVTNAGLTNIDVALSTRLKPADTLAGVTTVAAVTSITNALPAGANVIGHVINDTGSTTAVTGNVAVTNAGLTNLDVALSTRTKPSDQQHVIVDSSASIPVTGAFFQATQPVSATALPLPANAAQETGGNLATIASAIKSEDSLAVDLDKGIPILSVRQDVPLTDTSMTGDYAWLKADAQGQLWVNSGPLSRLLTAQIDLMQELITEVRVTNQLLQSGLNVKDDLEALRENYAVIH